MKKLANQEMYWVLVEKLNDLKAELEKIIELRTKGAILRSQIRWYNEGEKNTKYFLNLEKTDIAKKEL